MSSSGAVGAALLLCVAVAASASSVFYPGQQFLDESSSSEYGVLVMGSNVHGKVKHQCWVTQMLVQNRGAKCHYCNRRKRALNAESLTVGAKFDFCYTWEFPV